MTLSWQRKFSAQIIIYSVFSEMGKYLPRAALNLKNGEVHKLFLAQAILRLASTPETTATFLLLIGGQEVSKAAAEIRSPGVDHP